MAVFNQIKNFITSGKSHSSTKSRSSSFASHHSAQYETAQRIVEEENMAKQTMPSYAGLEDYQLLFKFGDGAFSKVYQAMKTSTKEKVAIKVVHKPEINQQQKASVLKEVQIMRTLDHPSIVKLLHFIETNEHYFLVLELCEGGEIFHQIVRLTYLSEELSRHVIYQVAKGIEYLHEERGVVHRDIKPENLLFVPIEFKERAVPLPPPSEFDEPKEDEGEFTPDVGGGGIGAVKIADFGLSKVVWDQHTMTPCGTVGYTAPEIVKDQRYSKSVDMWALGCVLYTALCGFPPFYDESIKTLTEKVAKGQYTFLSPWWDDISDEAKDLVEHLLDIDPDTRYTISQFLDHPWMKNQKLTNDTKLETHARSGSVDYTLDGQAPSITSIEDTGVPTTETEAEAFKRMIQERNRDEKELEEAVPFTASGVPSVINSRANSRAVSRANSIVTSGATSPRRDLFSGVTSMKEMLDISYAVHRMAEEKQRRRSLRSFEDPDAHRRSQFMNEINGDTSSDEEGLVVDETSSSSQTDNDDDEPVDKKKKSRGLFELNMDKATLLGRRKVPSATEPIDSALSQQRKVPSAMQPVDDLYPRKVPSAMQPVDDLYSRKVPSAMQPVDDLYPTPKSAATHPIDETLYHKNVQTPTQSIDLRPITPILDKKPETTTTHPLDIVKETKPRKVLSATQPIDD